MPENVNLNYIHSYREMLGVTQERLGELVGVTRQTIAAWEKGESTPTVVQLFKVSQALGVPVDLLLSQAPSSQPTLLFRADDPASLRPELRSLLSRGAADYAALERLMGETPVLPEARPIDGYDQATVERISREVRDWLGVEEGPLGDVHTLLELKDLKVVLHPLPKEVSGFSAYTEQWGGVIFVNKVHPPERQYFTALHELAHLIFHRQEYQGPYKKPTKGDNREKAANHLAGAVLLPREVVERELRCYRGKWIPEGLLLDIKYRYSVSMRTVLSRACQVGLISNTQMGQQMGTLFKRYGKESEPGNLPPPRGLSRLARLAYRAIAEDRITISRAAELLAKPFMEVQEELASWLEVGPA